MALSPQCIEQLVVCFDKIFKGIEYAPVYTEISGELDEVKIPINTGDEQSIVLTIRPNNINLDVNIQMNAYGDFHQLSRVFNYISHGILIEQNNILNILRREFQLNH